MPIVKFRNYHLQAVFDYIATHEGDCTIEKISAATWIGKNSVAEAIKKLERRGFIQRAAQGYKITALSNL